MLAKSRVSLAKSAVSAPHDDEARILRDKADEVREWPEEEVKGKRR